MHSRAVGETVIEEEDVVTLYSLEVGVSPHLCRSDAPVEHVTLASRALYTHSLFREGRWIFRLCEEHAKAS